MTFDQSTLFLATGICAVALSFALANAWLQSREDRFLFNWAFGILLLGVGVMLSMMVSPANMPMMALAYGMETTGFVIVYVASRQFAGRLAPARLTLLLAGLALPPVVLPFLGGTDAVSLFFFNCFAAALLAAAGRCYWSVRAEAPSSIAVMVVLYQLTALSFVCCAAMFAYEGRLVLHATPSNWAERFNAVMCISGITGIGALSLGLNNARAASRHHREARTDILTGLLNRRALFDRFAGQKLLPGHAVIAFDLDHFKSINDRHGHAAGDETLRLFARALRENSRDSDVAARTGGEEFVLVMRNASMQLAESTAERIRATFGAGSVETPSGELKATASAGIAIAEQGREPFEDLLHRADKSLYRAKNEGRNRVVTELQDAA